MANKNMIIALVLSFQSLAWLYSLFGFILSMQLTNKSKLSMVNEKDILYEDIFLNQIFKTMKNNTKK